LVPTIKKQNNKDKMFNFLKKVMRTLIKYLCLLIFNSSVSAMSIGHIRVRCTTQCSRLIENMLANTVCKSFKNSNVILSCEQKVNIRINLLTTFPKILKFKKINIQCTFVQCNWRYHRGCMGTTCEVVFVIKAAGYF
jgi:hypothetical protein